MTTFNPISADYAQQVTRTARPGTALPSAAAPGASFAELLRKKTGGVTFSAHASTRMSSRGIAMTPELLGKLEKAVTNAATKGARDSLVLTNNCAFIVNVPSRTVVTAMDSATMKENIFTNIDSAVIAD